MGTPSLDRLASLKYKLSSEGISNDCVNIICSAWRPGTCKQYQYAWKLWVEWCNSNNVQPMKASVKDILNFLTIQFHLGKSYSILNTYRSAISSVHDFIDNNPVGQHHLTVRFFKGVSNLRPSRPRYTFTWDVDCVLSFIETLWPLSNLSLKLLTYRLIALLALASAQRTQTLKFLDVSMLKFDNSGATFRLKNLTKTDKPGRFSTIYFPTFENNVKLCPCKTLQYYVDFTKD